MLCNKAIASFLVGAALLAASPSTCLARRTRAGTRRRLNILRKKNARHHGGKSHNKNRGRTCSRDAALEVLLHAELAILDIPFEIDNPRVLEGYVNDVRDCAMNFLQNLSCATIQEEMNQGRTESSPRMTDMKGRIMEEDNDTIGRIVIRPEQCCCDADAIKDMAVVHIRHIESSWARDVDGSYDIESIARKVEFGIFDGTKKRFAGALKTVGGIYIRELGSELAPVCYPPSEDQTVEDAVEAKESTSGFSDDSTETIYL